MALKKEITTKQGFNADYWKIGLICVDRNMKSFNFTLNLYLSKEQASVKDSFIDSRVYSSELYVNNGHDKVDDTTVYDKYIGENEDINIIEQCYLCAKKQDEFFRDAIDC